jgi:hypothetical protein
MIFLFVPETKGYTLEELDHVFSIPTATFIKYETSKRKPISGASGIVLTVNFTRPIASLLLQAMDLVQEERS